MSRDEIKYKYDEESGIFVKESNISTNWLVSEVLKQPKAQITKISNDDLQTFLTLVAELRMPDGTHCYVWLKNRLTERRLMSAAQLGQANEDLTNKYRYIIEQIDLRIIGNPKVLDIEKEEIVLKPNRTPNNMEISFEPK